MAGAAFVKKLRRFIQCAPLQAGIQILLPAEKERRGRRSRGVNGVNGEGVNGEFAM
jgi:hypothetical protein